MSIDTLISRPDGVEEGRMNKVSILADRRRDHNQSSEENAEFTEDGVAEEFAKRNPNLRWCQIWGKWLIWDGAVWKQDETVSVYDKIRLFCRENSEGLGLRDPAVIRQCSASFVAAVEKFCKSDRRYAAVPDQFDQNDWLLNTPGGVVNLRDGVLMDHVPERYCTKTTAVGPNGDCHRWHEFLGEITNENVGLIDFLQRVAGYCLTGLTSEHALFFAYGTGGNGKSVFMNTLTGILNDYARVSPMETFTESRNDRHPTELAMLQGARLVVAQETEQGKRWAQSRIKALTGGDPVTARYMRQDFFTYTPKFKLLIAGNTKPKLDTVDEAMRRRFHVIPFTVQIPLEDRDPMLSETLKAEWPGILSWAIEGALQYQDIGLAPPTIVAEATKNYLESQNVFAEWLNSECERGSGFWENPTALFNSWKRFAESALEHIGRQREFTERMEAAGYKQQRDKARGRYWPSLKVKHPNGPDHWQG